MPLDPPSEQESHAAFLGALNALGGSAGNSRLRELLEWDEATYQQVKTKLLARRTIVTGRGRGGSVVLASSIGEAGHFPWLIGFEETQISGG
jgi:type I restriction enzyme M protein